MAVAGLALMLQNSMPKILPFIEFRERTYGKEYGSVSIKIPNVVTNFKKILEVSYLFCFIWRLSPLAFLNT
jgi:hypothetical protein